MNKTVREVRWMNRVYLHLISLIGQRSAFATSNGEPSSGEPSTLTTIEYSPACSTETEASAPWQYGRVHTAPVAMQPACVLA